LEVNERRAGIRIVLENIEEYLNSGHPGRTGMEGSPD